MTGIMRRAALAACLVLAASAALPLPSLAMTTGTRPRPLPITPMPASRGDGDVTGITRLDAVAGVDRYRLRYRSDGLAIQGYLVIPREIAGRAAVILFAHGGSDDPGRPGLPLLDYLTRLAASGPFVVLATDYRGSAGSEGHDEFGGADVNDVVNLLPIARRLAMADADRVGMLGFSRGAIDTYVAIRRGAPLQAAAVVSGPTDLARTYEQTGLRVRTQISGMLGGTPEQRPEAYRLRSALDWPEKIGIPLLILHGDKDDRVALTGVQRLDAELTALNKPHRLLVFPGGKHMLHNFGAQRDQAIAAWFKQQLRIDPSPRSDRLASGKAGDQGKGHDRDQSRDGDAARAESVVTAVLDGQ